MRYLCDRLTQNDMDRLENLDAIILGLMADEHVGYQIPSALTEKQRMMRALMNVWEPKEMPARFLAAQDAELRQQAEDKGVVTTDELVCPLPTPRGEGQGDTGSLLLWQGDITRLRVDAIVNAANAQGLGCWAPLHNCIDNCIHSAAGVQLRKECRDRLQGRLLNTGEAMITRGYNLPARHVIHTVGPIVSLTSGPSPRGEGSDCLPTKEQEEQLAQCYRSCLDVADAREHRLLLHLDGRLPLPEPPRGADSRRHRPRVARRPSDVDGQAGRLQRLSRQGL